MGILPEWVVRAVGVLGFEDAVITYHSQKYKGISNELFTVVASRRHGSLDTGPSKERRRTREP